MSIWSDFLWTPQFITGSFVSGVAASVFTYYNTKASDKRTFDHEDDVLDRKEFREDLTEAQKEERSEKRRQDESLIASAEEFTQTCTEILLATVDMKGAFNAIRDQWNNMANKDDTAFEEKMEHGQKVAEAQLRLAGPLNRLKLTAPVKVCDAASKVSLAIIAVARMTTEPFALRAAQATATRELNEFMNTIREQIGQAKYTEDDAKKAAFSFMESFQRQTDDFIEQSRDEMRAAGHTSTPWDSYQRKTSKVPPPIM